MFPLTPSNTAQTLGLGPMPHSGHLPDVQRVCRPPAADASPYRQQNSRNLHDRSLASPQIAGMTRTGLNAHHCILRSGKWQS